MLKMKGEGGHSQPLLQDTEQKLVMVKPVGTAPTDRASSRCDVSDLVVAILLRRCTNNRHVGGWFAWHRTSPVVVV